MWKHMSDGPKKKEKQRWVSEKPKLDNGRQLRGIYFIEPNDEDFKLTRKAARRKWEPPMPAAMPCKLPVKSSGETHRNIGKGKTKYACVVDADERKHETKATRSWTQTSSRSHQCKRDEFYDSLQSCSEVHSNASSIKNSRRKGSSGDGKAAVEKTLEELKKIPAW